MGERRIPRKSTIENHTGGGYGDDEQAGIAAVYTMAAISIGKREEDPLPKSVAFLYVPAVLLVLLVLTNDLHQLVFSFPTYDTVWSDKDYSYGYGYYAKVVYHDVDSYQSLLNIMNDPSLDKKICE